MPTRPWATLADMSELAALAYGSRVDLESALQDRLVAGSYRHIPILLPGISSPFLTVATMYAHQQDGRLVIVFRGTDGPGDLHADALFAGEIALLGYSATLLRYAEHFLPFVQELIGAGVTSGATDIWFTGHSLGGMVAEQLVQWFHDPTDVHGLAPPAGTTVRGAAVGSPGIMDVEHVSPGSFFHITRDEDAIGTYQGEFHIGPTIRYTDPDADSLPGLLEHNHGRYAQQIRAFSSSDISHLLTDEVDIRLLAYDRDLNGLIAGGAGALSIRPVGGDGIVFFGTELADTVYGLGRLIVDLGAGDDHAAGSAANDIIAGGLGRDELRGAGGSDVLYGGAHDDALDGGGDNDQLFGGGGSDSYHVGIGHGYDIIEDGGGAMDTLALYTGAVASAFDYNWFSREGDDLLVRIPDGAGGWHINVRIKDMGTTAGGIERVELWAGTGTALTNTWDLTALWAGLSGPEAPSPPPTSQPPGVAPETRDDVIILGAGNDEARISGGRDQVDGGDGIDRLVIDYGDATLNVRADLNDAYVGSFGGARSVWIQRIESLTVFGGSGADEMTGGNYEDLFYGGAGNDELDGDDGDDTLDGGSGSDLLIGGTGEDVLTSGAGDDTLYAKEWQNGGLLSADLSADWLDGGAGIDRVGVDLWGETRDVTFLGSQAASDTGFTFVNGTHVRNAEQFTVRTGSGADRVWDGAFDDSFDLGSGDDLAHVSRGRDQVHGGDGIDRLVVDYRDATLNVYASLDDAYVGSINSDRSVWIQWFEALTVFGGSGADEMVGGNYEDLFYGGAGNDELDGDDGDDTIDGGSGNDLLTGGTGEDVLAGGAGDDTLYAKEWQNGGLLSADLSADWLDGGAGIDRVGVDLWGETRDVTFLGSQAASATGFTFVNGTHVRNAEQFTVRTGSGADRVWDGAFDDSFNLGSGDDLAHVSRGRDQADGGDGTDRLVIDYRDATMNVRATLGSAYVGSFNSERSVLIDWFEALTVFGGSGADEMTGGNDEDLFYGGAGNDDLEGDDGDDVLDGGSGDDILNGGDGDDILDGGLGDDLLNGGNGVDTVTFATASTATRVQLARTADQPTGGGARDTITGVENLTGSAFDDDFSGDEGANVLADTLGGDDRFIGAAGNDTLIIERSGGGAATTSLLRGGLDEDVLSFDGHGRYTDTVAFEGQDGNDVISAAGAFKANINAGGGNDTVTVDTLGGSFVVKLGSGSDTLVLAGTGGAFAGSTANLVRDFAAGNGGDVLDLTAYLAGGALTNFTAGSNPFLSGHMRLVQAGADTLVQVDRNGGGNSFVTVVTLQKTLTSSFTAFNFNGLAPLPAPVEGGAGADVLNGTSAIDVLNGNGGDDVLTGGAGNDVLNGGAASDVLDGGAGDDVLNGGSGAQGDTATYASATAGVNVNLAIVGNQQDTGGSGFDSLTGIEHLVGSAFTDELRGDGFANRLTDTSGGNDFLRGEAGDDALLIARSGGGAATTVRLNGGDGADSLTFAGNGRYSDTVTLEGEAGDDLITVSGAGTVGIDAGAGADTVVYDTLGGAFRITLGEGSDTVRLASTGGQFAASGDNLVRDFATGPGGDRVDLSAWLAGGALTNYGGGNPFADGHMRLVQNGSRTLLQVDRDGGGNGYQTVLAFTNTTAASFTAANFNGFDPTGLAPMPVESADKALDAGPQTLPGLADDAFLVLPGETKAAFEEPLVLPGAGLDGQADRTGVFAFADALPVHLMAMHDRDSLPGGPRDSGQDDGF